MHRVIKPLVQSQLLRAAAAPRATNTGGEHAVCNGGGPAALTNTAVGARYEQRRDGGQQASNSKAGSNCCDWLRHNPVLVTAAAASLACGHQLFELRARSARVTRRQLGRLADIAEDDAEADVDSGIERRRSPCALPALVRRAYARPVFTAHHVLPAAGGALPKRSETAAQNDGPDAECADAAGERPRPQFKANKRVTFDVQCQTAEPPSSACTALNESTSAFHQLLTGAESHLNTRIGLSALGVGLRAEGFRYLRMAHENDPDDALALYNLALCYAKGTGVKQDYEKAYSLWQRGALQGDAGCMYQMAVCLARRLVDADAGDSADRARALLAAAYRRGYRCELTELAAEAEEAASVTAGGIRRRASI